jgi:hypothetical protein
MPERRGATDPHGTRSSAAPRFHDRFDRDGSDVAWQSPLNEYSYWSGAVVLPNGDIEIWCRQRE